MKLSAKQYSDDEHLIVALGDSLTAGWMVSRGYPHFLGELLADANRTARVIAAGYPGETALDGLRRLPVVASYAPGVVILQYALNDLFAGYTAQAYRAAIESMITELSEWGARAVLMTSIPLPQGPDGERLADFYDVLDDLSRKYAIPLGRFDLLLSEALDMDEDPGRYFLGDGIHPSEEGYRIMAQAAFEALSPLLPEKKEE